MKVVSYVELFYQLELNRVINLTGTDAEFLGSLFDGLYHRIHHRHLHHVPHKLLPYAEINKQLHKQKTNSYTNKKLLNKKKQKIAHVEF